MARRTLALLAGLLALVFFGSVVCPPVHERGAAPSETVGVADTLPQPEQARALRVQVVDDRGAALEDAVVELRTEGDPPLYARATVREGAATFLAPGAGVVLLSARAAGHLPVDGQALTLPLDEDAAPPTLVLARAAAVEGQVRGLDGGPVVYGELLLRAADGEERVLRARGAGLFASGPLPPGAWTVLWRRHPHDTVDPLLVHEARLEAGATLTLDFTIADGDPPQPGREVGVRVREP